MSRGRPKSSVWEAFEKKLVAGKQIITCRFCLAEYSGTTSAYRLVDHLVQCEAAPETEREFAMAQQKARACQPKWKPGDGKGAGPSQELPGWGREAVTWPEKKRLLQESMAELFFAENMALSIADGHFWKRFICELRSTFSSPCSHTLRGRLLCKKSAEADAARIQLVRSTPAVSLSVDGWTNIHREQVLHFVVCTPYPVLLKACRRCGQMRCRIHCGQTVGDRR